MWQAAQWVGALDDAGMCDKNVVILGLLGMRSTFWICACSFPPSHPLVRTIVNRVSCALCHIVLRKASLLERSSCQYVVCWNIQTENATAITRLSIFPETLAVDATGLVLQESCVCFSVSV